MHTIKSCLGFVLLALVVTGCSSDKKAPLPGNRISVLDYQDSSKADEKAKNVTISLAPMVANAEWNQAGGNAAHTPQHLAFSSNPMTKAWSAKIGKGSDNSRKLLTSPVIGNNLVFAADTTGTISAYDLATGKQVWRINIFKDKDASAAVSAGLAFSGKVLYVTDGITHVHALNAANGQTIWKQKMEQPVRGLPTILDGRVYIMTLNDETIALSAKDGKTIWRHEGIPESTGLLGAPSPAVQGSVVVTAYSSGDIAALRAETGQEAWSDNVTGGTDAQNRTVTRLTGFRGHPVLDQDVVYVGNANSRMIAVHVPSGERIWQKEFGIMSTPWVSGNMVFALTSKNDLVALVKETGQLAWTLNLARYEDPDDKEDAIFWTGPILAGGRLIIAGNKALVEVDAKTGKILRATDLGKRTPAPPVVAQKTLIVVMDNGNMVAYK